MHADPTLFRQTLLDSVTDATLEELTLRFARPDYPDAHLSGVGEDGGIDVLSDLEPQPARGWQCKNHKKIKWDDCRESLRRAMSDVHPPPHYTFVFPRPLTGRQRDWWRKEFLPQQRALYPQLETLDFWDDLATRLDRHPELFNQLSGGALSTSYETVATMMAQTGVNPLASVADLVGDAPALARRAVETGRSDPRYRFENRQREAHAEDRTIPDGRVRFGFDAPIGRPREFTATIRSDDAVEEKAARPRDNVELGPVTVWFSDTEAGRTYREQVRGELAAGRSVDLRGDPDIGLDARPLPDRFASIADPDGILRSGEIHIGLSEPFKLRITLEDESGTSPTAELPLYRIPSDPEFSVSYGGAFHGAIVFLDIDPDAARPDGQSGQWTDTSIGVYLDISGVPATELITGLGLVQAFGRATRLDLECEGLLPDDKMDFDASDRGTDQQTEAMLKDITFIAAALAQLTVLDGRPRYLSSLVTAYDAAIAETVLELLLYGEIRQQLPAGYQYSIPEDVETDDPKELMRGVRRALGELSGEPTVVVELRIEGAAEATLLNLDGKSTLEVTPRDGGAEVVMSLVGAAAAEPSTV